MPQGMGYSKYDSAGKPKKAMKKKAKKSGGSKPAVQVTPR